jgi:regulator of cell morphogenesis and NO signaling
MIAAESTLRSIALEQPATIPVFERFHLDYCCGGNRPLSEACAQKGLELNTVLAGLAEAANVTETTTENFAHATPAELIRHIVQTHHAFIRGELPRLLPLAERSARKHGPAHPELDQIQRQLCQLGDDLLHHLDKEETILFPYIEALERSRNSGASAPQACFATVESPIQAMINEHEAAGALLEEMRAATQGFTPPTDACPTLVGLLHGLDAFERDLHRHVHLENNLLFPLAVALEKESRAAGQFCSMRSHEVASSQG